LRYRDLVVYDRSPNVRMLRLSVFGCLLIGFFITVAALQSFGGALLSARSPECLLALCLVWVLVALGLTAFGAAAPEPQHPIAGGLRSFACTLAGAALGAAIGHTLTSVDGSAIAFASLGLSILVALLSLSVDRRAWLLHWR
jgi:hypothetical protein